MYAFLIGATVIFLTGCNTTNRLAQYPILGSTALFNTQVPPKASLDVDICDDDSLLAKSQPKDEDTTRPRQDDWIERVNETVETVVAAVEILSMVTTPFIESAVAHRLRPAIVPEELALAAGRSFQKAAEDYLRLRPVRSQEDEPAFLVETILEEFTLESCNAGVRAQVQVRSRIIHRRTTRIVWENFERASAPLQHVTARGPGSGVLPAELLLSLQPEEIRHILAQAAQQAGQKLGEKLRKDVEKLPRKGA
ncbi:MAG: hypothetical protein NZ960_02725 [Candidatus Kapabacteria bacterium]|nr:hypothetical protein [Candidatus Kapabacteria bacterium]